MTDSQLRSDTRATPDEPIVQPFSNGVDETLVDLMLEQTISDRLRSLCRYVNVRARFQRV